LALPVLARALADATVLGCALLACFAAGCALLACLAPVLALAVFVVLLALDVFVALLAFVTFMFEAFLCAEVLPCDLVLLSIAESLDAGVVAVDASASI